MSALFLLFSSALTLPFPAPRQESWSPSLANSHYDLPEGQLKSAYGCLDIGMDSRVGETGRGRNVIAWPCHGKENQQWFFERGLLHSQAGNGNWCLDIDTRDRIRADGSGRNVIVWPCHGKANQRWELVDDQIVNRMNGQAWCLDVALGAPTSPDGPGRNVVAWPCHDGRNQQWGFTP